MKKYNFLLLASIGLLFLFFNFSQTVEAGDALAIRVMENSNHMSIMSWYDKFVENKGAPQELTVDGYDAIRDGRTVYVNAANLDGNIPVNGDLSSLMLNTYIYIISYSQNPDSATIDVFGRILEHWKFNNQDNIKDMPGNCVVDADDTSTNEYCIIDSDCSNVKYCNSLKAQIIRDVRRLGDVADIYEAMNNYDPVNNTYPDLLSGTYLQERTYSTWPSWQDTLSINLKTTLPIDPLNKFYGCTGTYNSNTCWDEINKEFDGDASGENGPLDSRSKFYSVNVNSSYEQIFWKMEKIYSNFNPAPNDYLTISYTTSSLTWPI